MRVLRQLESSDLALQTQTRRESHRRDSRNHKIRARPFIEFADDNSFVHREHYQRLLRELAKENLRWFTEADINVAKDDARRPMRTSSRPNSFKELFELLRIIW